MITEVNLERRLRLKHRWNETYVAFDCLFRPDKTRTASLSNGFKLTTYKGS
jgi:hypothetical protein